jgi:integrase
VAIWWRFELEPHSMVKLTKQPLASLKPRAKPYIEYDTELIGFGVAVYPSGIKSWVCEYRPHGGGRGIAKKRVTLGKISQLTADQARKAAADMLAAVRLGGDPAQEKIERRASVTVGQLIDLFDAQYVGPMLKPGTTVSHRIALEKLRRAHGGLKATALTRAHVTTLHFCMADRPYAANRAAAVWSKAFAWAADAGLIPTGHNPVKGLKKYREQGRERFLTSEELARLGDKLREGENVGLPYTVDETKPTAKHAPKAERRRVKLDRYAAAAIRLLILTGARLREILHARWEQVDIERGLIFLEDSKTGRKPLYLSAAALEVLADLPRRESACDCRSETRDATLRPQETMGCCEPSGRLGRRSSPRPAPFLRQHRRRRISRIADYWEVARSLATRDDGEICAFGRGPDAARCKYNWRNDFGCYGGSQGSQPRAD